jgi:arylsulfatase A-like enzyme
VRVKEFACLSASGMRGHVPRTENTLISASYTNTALRSGRTRDNQPCLRRSGYQGGAPAPRQGQAVAMACCLALCLTAACTPTTEPEIPSDGPLSVLLLVIDTVRADRLGFYGHTRPSSPNLDTRAHNWVVFDAAMAPAPFTMPSVAALMTGQYPDRTGVVNHSGDSSLTYCEAPTMAELARKSGRRTAGVVTNPWLTNKMMGFSRGFDAFGGKVPKRTPKPDAKAVTTGLLGQLDEIGDAPFMMWGHYLDPHMPYRPLLEDAQALGLRYATSAVIRDFTDHKHDKQTIIFKAPYREGILATTRLLYEAEIRRVDREIDRLLDGLAERGRDKDTVVILVSDHGESMGEHQLWFAHDFTLYEELIHVALAVRAPGIEGHHVREPVSLIDVMPSVCGWLDLDCRHKMDGVALPLRGQGDTKRTLFAASAPWRPRYDRWHRLEVPGLAGRWRAARQGNLKLIKIPGSEHATFEAYDLGTDPAELNNLWPAQKFIRLLKNLQDWEREMQDIRPHSLATFQLDEQTRQDLEALGYLDDGRP